MFDILSGLRTRRQQRSSSRKAKSSRKSFFEALEGRDLLATLTWVGDVDTNWNTNTAGNTNWTADALPVDGDTLVFSTPGVVTLNNDTTAGNSYALQFTAVGYTINGNSITLDVAGDDITDNSSSAINTPLTFANSTFNINAGTTSFGGSHGGTSLTKTGTGGLVLAGAASNYSGGTTVSGGLVTAQSASALGTGSVALGGNTLNLAAGAVNYTFGGMTSTAAGVVNVTLGTGAATTGFAAGAYAGFLGTLNVGTGVGDDGKLAINNLASLTSAATINVLTDATVFAGAAGNYNAPIFLNGGNTGESLGQLRVENGTYVGTVTLAGAITGANDAYIGTNAGTGTISGNIVETVAGTSLSKSGAGTTVLTGNANNTGGYAILNGTLQVGNGGATGTLNTAGNIVLTGTLSVNKSSATSIPNPVSIAGAGAGAFTKAGAGSVTFTVPGGGNTFKLINVNNATNFLDLGAGTTTLSNLGGNIIQSTTGGNLRATGGTVLMSGVNATDGGNIGSGAGTLIIDAVLNTVTAGHPLELFGGGSVVRLTAINPLTGNVVVNQGILETALVGNSGGASPLGTGTTIHLGNGVTGTTYRYIGTGETTNRTFNLRGSTGGGTIEHNGTGPFEITSAITATGAGSKSLTLSGTATGLNRGQISGQIQNNSGTNVTSLVKNGTGIWNVTGNNGVAGSFTGNVTINASALRINNSSALGIGPKTVSATSNVNNTHLRLDGSGGNITLAANISFTTSNDTNAGTIVNEAGDNVINGNFTMATGGGGTMLNVLAGSLTTNGTFTPNTTGRTLTLRGSGNNFFNGSLNNNGANIPALAKDEASTWTLGGNSSYSGTTTIIAGTLVQNGSVTGNGAVAVNNGSQLTGTGSFAGPVSVNNTARLSPGNTGTPLESLGTGALTFAGSSFFDVQLNGPGAVDSAIVAGAATLNNATLNLTGTFVPDSSVLNTFTIIDSSTGVTGNFAGLLEGQVFLFNGQELFISYRGGADGNDVVLSTQLMGTPAGDSVVYTPVNNTSYQYTIGAAGPFTVNEPRFVFNAGGGDDVLRVNLNGSLIVPDFRYNGETQSSPLTGGTNTLHGDVLSVIDGTNTYSASYLPNGVANPALDNDGAVTVTGQGTVNFTGLEPVDLVGLASVSLFFPNANDVVTLDNGFDAATNTLPALVVSGNSGGVAFEAAHLRNNTLVTIHTVTLGVDGNDTVTLAGGNNGHGNAELIVNTGTGTDSITVTGDTNFTTRASLISQNIAFNGGTLTTGSFVTFNANSGAVTTSGPGVDVVTGFVTGQATTGIDFDTTVDSLGAGVTNLGAGNIQIDETNDINLSSLIAANGSITVNAAGLITVTNVTSSTDVDANDITLSTSVGNIVVGTIVTGGAESDVTLTATTGSVLDDLADNLTDVTADLLTITAASGIGALPGAILALDTSANVLDASVTSAGGINVNEASAINLLDVDTFNGPITVVAGSGLVATDVQSLADDAANDITLTATTGDLTVNVITAGATAGEVILRAIAGNIRDDNADGTVITANFLLMNAAAQIGAPFTAPATEDIDTLVNSLSFTSSTGAWITESNEVLVGTTVFNSTSGPIVLESAGDMTLVGNVNNAGGNVRITTTGTADLIIGSGGAIIAGGAAPSVRLNVASDVVDTTVANDITALNLNMTVGGDVGPGNPLDTNITNLAANVTGDLFLNENDTLDITTVSAFGVSLSGLLVGDTTVINANGAINVLDDVTSGFDVTLNANETAAATDSVVLDAAGQTVRSTGGAVTLGFGDDETLAAHHSLIAMTDVRLISLDTDAGSIITMNGVLSAATVFAEGAGNADQFYLIPLTSIFNPGTIVNMIGRGGDDNFGDATLRINPDPRARFEIDGENNTAVIGEPLVDNDTLYLDAAVLEAPIVFFAGFDQGFLQGANVPAYGTVRYQDIEELFFYDNLDDDLPGPPNSGNLTTIELGNLYVRTTAGNDTVTFGRSGITSTDEVVVTINYPRAGGTATLKSPAIPMGPIAATGRIVAFGKGGNDRIAASATLGNRNLEFHGDDGNDYLAGQGGDDLLIGGRGNDTILAGNGTNVIWGDEEFGFNDAAGVVGQTYNDTITAGSGNDILYGNLGNDSLSSGAGSDTVYGGYGNDTLNGGSQNDLLRGGEGNDTVDGGAGDDILLGSGGNDKLYGRDGNDIVLAGAGKDSITGDAGNDIVSGGLHTSFNEQATLGDTQTADAALLAILAAWSGSGNGTGLDGLITDDLTADTVSGGTGLDRYYVHSLPAFPVAERDTFGPLEVGETKFDI